MNEFDELHDRLIAISSTLDIQKERVYIEARIEELEERKLKLSGEILRRIHDGSL